MGLGQPGICYGDSDTALMWGGVLNMSTTPHDLHEPLSCVSSNWSIGIKT